MSGRAKLHQKTQPNSLVHAHLTIIPIHIAVEVTLSRYGTTWFSFRNQYMSGFRISMFAVYDLPSISHLAMR